MFWLIGLLALFLGLTAVWSRRPRGVAPAPGEAAPPFALAGSDGQVHTLEESRGRHVVLAWFPKAFTAGCAAECRSLRTEGPDLRGFDADYYAVSVDRAETNGRFATSLGVDFPILADPTRETARAYGVIVTLEPVVAAMVGALVLGQALPPTALVAIACVTVAAVGVTLSDRRGAVIASPPAG